MKYFLRSGIVFCLLLSAKFSSCQYTHQDTLRGSVGPGRDWWNVLRYDISVEPDYAGKSILASCGILFKTLKRGELMQIDLQEPMIIDSIHLLSTGNNKENITNYKREGNVYWVTVGKLKAGITHSLVIYYHGKPVIAAMPPWDGGWIFTKDEKGRPWMTVACQGLGASVWYPCKDYQGDEPDSGASLTMTVADSLVAVGNGRLVNRLRHNNGTMTWVWEVKNPINNYDIIPYIGKYINWEEKYDGEKGALDCSYWVMDYNEEKAKKQFDLNVKPMLSCFEYWFGPYPFYEDSYKLVETPHLGMEHQSAVAYGNHYVNGYYVGNNSGRDLSGTGWGMKWDYIIIHESGHEWFGNNITTNDIADMWVHEGFTDYSETLFVECQYGKEAADEYTQGLRRSISNRNTVIGPYNVNKEGSGDMYNKGNNLLHTIRQVINDDSLFRKILRGLNKEFYHKTVDSKDVEAYISKVSGKDLSRIFDQYLRNTKIPVLEYAIEQRQTGSDIYYIKYKWSNCIPGFNMPIKVRIDKKETWLNPSTQEAVLAVKSSNDETPEFSVDRNFYITSKKTN